MFRRREKSDRVSPFLRVDTLTQSVLFLLLMTFFQRGIGFVRGILFCGWLEPEELGQWDLAYGFLMLAAPVAVLGLPGTFARYLEHYRLRGQARGFLRRTSTWIAALAALATIWMLLQPDWFSQLIFGRPNENRLVWVICLTLLATIAFNYVYELFGGLRMFRVVSIMQFVQSMLFCILGIGLLTWQTTAYSVVLAYLMSTAACVALACLWVRPTIDTLPDAAAPLAASELGRKLLPFAASVWITNWLTNLFEITDRYMLVHFSGLPAEVALSQVGNYHAARVLPLVMVAVAALLRSAVLPHLSHDWEQGRRNEVHQQLSLACRMLGLVLVAGSICLLCLAPFIFEYGFKGKYDGGLAVLPWTLTYLAWVGIMFVASTYIWIAERASLGSLALALGVAVNIGLNLLLVPWLQLKGAVLATVAANAVTLSTTFLFNHWTGMRFDRGMLVVALSPLILVTGPLVATAVFLAILHQACTRNWIFNAQERAMCIELARGILAKLGWKRWAIQQSAVP